MLFPNGLHLDIQDKIFGTQDLSPLFSVINNKKEPLSGSNSGMVNLVQSNWNILVEDFYRVRGIITVLYPTNYIPGISRTNEHEPKR